MFITPIVLQYRLNPQSTNRRSITLYVAVYSMYLCNFINIKNKFLNTLEPLIYLQKVKWLFDNIWSIVKIKMKLCLFIKHIKIHLIYGGNSDWKYFLFIMSLHVNLCLKINNTFYICAEKYLLSLSCLFTCKDSKISPVKIKNFTQWYSNDIDRKLRKITPKFLDVKILYTVSIIKIQNIKIIII